MLTQDLIESITTGALTGLCSTCALAETCVHHKRTGKVIIQCELFEPGGEVQSTTAVTVPLKGLCTNCSQAPFCRLHEAQWGIWHCEAYEEL
jgi:hypothetical protein